MQNSEFRKTKSLLKAAEKNANLVELEEEEKQQTKRFQTISRPILNENREYLFNINENEDTADAAASASAASSSRKVKSSRSRLSSAFRSFRSGASGDNGTKFGKKKFPALAAISAAVVAEAVISSSGGSGGGVDEIDHHHHFQPIHLRSHATSPNTTAAATTSEATSDGTTKKKKSKLAKRFSLSGYKKHKISPKHSDNESPVAPGPVQVSAELISSGTQTTTSLDRRQIDGLLLPTTPTTTNDCTFDSELLTPKFNLTGRSSTISSTVTATPTPPESPQKYEKIRKLQITIQGKKIEHTHLTTTTQQNTNNNGGGSKRNLPTTATVISSGAESQFNNSTLGDEDYLLAIPSTTTTRPEKGETTIANATTTIATAAAVAVAAATTSKRNQKKKLKLKKAAAAAATNAYNNNGNNNNSTCMVVNSTRTSSVSPVEEKTFIITHSIRDTPPRERAPAKPNRIQTPSSTTTPINVSYSTVGTVIRKSSIPTLVAPVLAPIAVAASAAATNTITTTTLKRQRSRGESIDPQLNLMQREGTIDRGRRFPRPTLSIQSSIAAGGGSREEPSTPTSPPPLPLTLPTIPNQQRRIQFQLHSHEHFQSSQSLPSSHLSQTEPEPPTTTTASLPPLTFIPSQKQQKLQPPQSTTPRPPPPPLQRHSTSTLPAQLSEEATVTIASSSGPDDSLTSSDSQQQQEQHQQLTRADTNNIKYRKNSFSRQFASTTISFKSASYKDDITSQESNGIDDINEDYDDTSYNSDRPKVSFAVGTAVRHQRTSLLEPVADTKEFSSIGSSSIRSSGSHSPVTSESSAHQRRIHYVGQPTVYTEDERDIIEGRRSFLSGISEYSFDSENEPSETQMPAFGDLTMDQEEPPIMTTSGEKREHLYKILVIGELGTGKTSFIKRYVHQFFSQNYRATIGVDFALKVLHWDPNTIVRLQLWDIAGQERFGNMTRVYYKEAVGAFIVFDVTRSGTFDCVSKWKEDLDSKVQLPDGSPIPCILLANKCDQDKQGIVTTPEKMDEYIRDNGFAGWYETSAKENINIDEAARALVNKILLNDKLISAADLADSERFSLNNSGGSQTTAQSLKNKCSC